MSIIEPPYATCRVPGSRASQAVHLFLVSPFLCHKRAGASDPGGFPLKFELCNRVATGHYPYNKYKPLYRCILHHIGSQRETNTHAIFTYFAYLWLYLENQQIMASRSERAS